MCVIADGWDAVPSKVIWEDDSFEYFMGLKGRPDSGLLDLTVRTDTKGVGRGSGGCILPAPRVRS